MNQTALFVGGLLLGVLISVSLLQSDFISVLFGKSALNGAVLSHLSTPISQSTLFNQSKIIVSASSSVSSSPDLSLQTTALSTHTDNSKTVANPLQQQEIPKWTPGRGSELDKYRKEAQIAQEIMTAVGTNIPPSATTKPSPITDNNDIQAIKENLKAIGRQIKKLRRRQIDLEQNGRDSSEVKAKITELLNKRSSPLTPTPTSATSQPVDKGAEEELAAAFDVAAGRKSVKPKQPVVEDVADVASSIITLPPPPIQSQSNTIGPWPDVNNPSLYQARSITPGLPPIPYHNQALRDWEKYEPYQPTLEGVTKELSSAGSTSNNNKKQAVTLPDLSKQRGIIEPSNLKLHMCNAVFEAYSASYLTTREHVLAVGSEGYNLTWVNCEMASFIHMKESNRFYQNPHAPTSHGIIIQTLDVLDYSAIHLSAFERSQKKHKDAIWNNEKDRRRKWKEIKEVEVARDYLRRLNDPSVRDKNRNIRYSKEAQRTVVVMPFLGGAMGAGHSELGNRFVYLQTCFWSLYEFFPHIVAGVARQEDVAWAFNESGLPFFDIILLPSLPKSAGLPVGTMQAVKQRFLRTSQPQQAGQSSMPRVVTQGHPEGINPVSQNPRYPSNSLNWAERFDYVFFTESDQIVIIRELALLYRHLKQFPRHMLLPHRLMPYSQPAMVKGHTRKDVPSIKTNAWMNQSCCMPRQNCVERKTWKPLSDVSVPVVSYYGLLVPLGNVNFLTESYRYCKLGGYVDYCP